MNFFKIFTRFTATKGIQLAAAVPILCYLQQKNYQCTPMYYVFLSHQQLTQLRTKYPNLVIVEKQYTEHILSVLRNKDTKTQQFRQYADRMIRILLEKALAYHEKKTIHRESPVGIFESTELSYEDDEYCVVSILRSGNAFLPEIFRLLPGIKVGQILIQRNEETAEPSLYYSKLPQDIAKKKIFLVDPMLGTGGSAAMAMKVLKNHGVIEENGANKVQYIFLYGQGIHKVLHENPNIKIITAQVDPILLKDSKFLAPGIGDFGDRYFGTQH